MKFKDLGLSREILRALDDMGFEEPTPIQESAIPIVMQGVDVIGQAQTGTGKTASFGIPVLEKIDMTIHSPQVLILSPTRELTIQSCNELQRLACYMPHISIVSVYGGADMLRQIRALKQGAGIIIGTPGRVMDHMRRKTLDMTHIHTIVLDEADEMLNMGFREDIETILDSIHDDNRQVILFSATMAQAIMDITTKYQRNAQVVKVESQELTVSNIEQYYYDVHHKNKIDVLIRLIHYYDPKLSVVFCNTKSMVDEVAEQLQSRGLQAESLHGDLKQAQRDKVMKRFRAGQIDILIATDVAARGIDVDDIEAVFNYDIPREQEFYVHRIGRTGRAGRSGRAFNFIRNGKEARMLRDIQKYCKATISFQFVPTYAQVQAQRSQRLLSQAVQIIGTRDVSFLREYIDAQPYPVEDIATALLAYVLGNDTADDDTLDAQIARDKERGSDGDILITGLSKKRKDKTKSSQRYSDHNDKRGEKTERNNRKRQLHNRSVEEGMVRFTISLGKKHGIRPHDIVRIISSEAHIPGFSIGAIELTDHHSYVEIPEKSSGKVLKSCKKAKFKGKKLGLELTFTQGRHKAKK